MTDINALDDVAVAAQLVAAISAKDEPGWAAAITQIRESGRTEQVTLALASKVVEIAGDFYDTDRQAILDGQALDALAKARRARGLPLDDDGDDD